jgi:hypothetical protein
MFIGMVIKSLGIMKPEEMNLQDMAINITSTKYMYDKLTKTQRQKTASAYEQ